MDVKIASRQGAPKSGIDYLVDGVLAAKDIRRFKSDHTTAFLSIRRGSAVANEIVLRPQPRGSDRISRGGPVAPRDRVFPVDKLARGKAKSSGFGEFGGPILGLAQWRGQQPLEGSEVTRALGLENCTDASTIRKFRHRILHCCRLVQRNR